MAVKLEYCRSCDHTHLVGTACWFVPPVVAEVRRAQPRKPVDEFPEHTRCLEELTALRGRLRGLEQQWRKSATYPPDSSERRAWVNGCQTCADELAALLAPPEEP